MTGKATATAPANIAFIKYWGARDPARAIPWNASISMTLARCWSRTTVAFDAGSGEPDGVVVLDERGGVREASGSFRDRVTAHLDRLRRRAARDGSFRVTTHNSFPTGAGIASSASGFAALTVAACAALDVVVTPAEMSQLARASGSGSAARSVLGGFVEWPAPGAGAEAGAVSLAPASHWDLRDVIVVVDRDEKRVSSVEGHRRAASSPHWPARLNLVSARLDAARGAIAHRDLDALGPVLEDEAVELHLIAMSSRPPIFYWKPATLRVLDEVRTLRRAGMRAWSTMDAGANVHVICPAGDDRDVAAAMRRVEGVLEVIEDRVGDGPRLEREHLA